MKNNWWQEELGTLTCLTTFLALILIYIMFSSAWPLIFKHIEDSKMVLQRRYHPCMFDIWMPYWLHEHFYNRCLLYDVALEEHCLLHKSQYSKCVLASGVVENLSRVCADNHMYFSSTQIWWYILQIYVVKARSESSQNVHYVLMLFWANIEALVKWSTRSETS